MMNNRFMTLFLPSSSLLLLCFLFRSFLPSEFLPQVSEHLPELLDILRLFKDQIPDAEAQYGIEHMVKWNSCHGSPSFLLEA